MLVRLPPLLFIQLLTLTETVPYTRQHIWGHDEEVKFGSQTHNTFAASKSTSSALIVMSLVTFDSQQGECLLAFRFYNL